MRAPLLVVLACLGPGVSFVACSAGRIERETGTVSFPAHFAEGEVQDAGTPERARPGTPAPPAPVDSAPPDPEPLRIARQWEYDLIYDSGQVRVASVRALRFAQPVVTQRFVGRFAIELWIGHELVERVRFDFPLLGAEEPQKGPRRPLQEPPNFSEGARVQRKLLVPASPRATRAVLVDRATGAIQALPWPPDAPLDPAPAR